MDHHDAFYASSISRNLVSLIRLGEEGYAFQFSDSHLYVYLNIFNILIDIGIKLDALFRFDL